MIGSSVASQRKMIGECKMDIFSQVVTWGIIGFEIVVVVVVCFEVYGLWKLSRGPR